MWNSLCFFPIPKKGCLYTFYCKKKLGTIKMWVLMQVIKADQRNLSDEGKADISGKIWDSETFDQLQISRSKGGILTSEHVEGALGMTVSQSIITSLWMSLWFHQTMCEWCGAESCETGVMITWRAAQSRHQSLGQNHMHCSCATTEEAIVFKKKLYF